MRPGTNSTAAAAAAAIGGINHWKTPIPYLFGGLAVMLALIATALAILSCSNSKAPPNGAAAAEAEAAESKHVRMEMEMEPKFVVIMAGDELPRYLAKPVGAAATCRCAD